MYKRAAIGVCSLPDIEFRNAMNFFRLKFHAFRKIIVYLHCQSQARLSHQRPRLANGLHTKYIKAFSKRFDFDDVRTSQTPITCQESKQRKRPVRCICSGERRLALVCLATHTYSHGAFALLGLQTGRQCEGLYILNRAGGKPHFRERHQHQDEVHEFNSPRIEWSTNLTVHEFNSPRI